MDKAEQCPECGYTDADARLHMDHLRCKNYPFFIHPGGYEAGCVRSDVPTGQIPSAKNQFLMLLQLNGLIDELNGAANAATHSEVQRWLNYVRGRIEQIVKAVAVDTNEECETASQAHTGTKD